MAHLKKADTRSKEEQQEDVLTAYENCGNVSQACKKAKVARRTFYNWLAETKEDGTECDFKTRFNEASAIAIGMLEDEAQRRAVKGTIKPVYQGGKKVGSVREFSDTLLIFLLKGNHPEKYKDRYSAELGGLGGGPIQSESTVLILPANGREITTPDGEK
jgi:hypothetical protein